MVSKLKFDEDRQQINNAWKFLRMKNQSIPNDIIDLMRDAALKEIDNREKHIEFLCNYIPNQEEINQVLRHQTPKN